MIYEDGRSRAVKGEADSDWDRHQRRITEYDQEEAILESRLERVRESRREYSNRHNLNALIKEQNKQR